MTHETRQQREIKKNEFQKVKSIIVLWWWPRLFSACLFIYLCDKIDIETCADQSLRFIVTIHITPNY